MLIAGGFLIGVSGYQALAEVGGLILAGRLCDEALKRVMMGEVRMRS